MSIGTAQARDARIDHAVADVYLA
jgi:hypothetical protein